MAIDGVVILGIVSTLPADAGRVCGVAEPKPVPEITILCLGSISAKMGVIEHITGGTENKDALVVTVVVTVAVVDNVV